MQYRSRSVFFFFLTCRFFLPRSRDVLPLPTCLQRRGSMNMPVQQHAAVMMWFPCGLPTNEFAPSSMVFEK
ncbi:hypothetical protein B0T25DRAFT_556411 [Lasiosphaeria hispida]|uniref:Uncharacterized protein n=1 Tax=Lasiosphaeria hispida TaxID=260671 RepID=A0AAJ0HA53_9PEZI|nr:hypothetical protein B0T25DRAFT_556411 [Lasiosphaeria hispida]